MRIDPEAVYLELSEGTTVYNFATGGTRVAPAVILHWKDGRKWQRASFIADEGCTLAALIAKLAVGLGDDHLDAFLTRVTQARTAA